MRYITCASYYGTGSSAITDLVAEYEGVHCTTEEEFRFLHDPDGVDDLYFHLVENHNRHNSGHAIKRYLKLVDYLAGNAFSKKYSAYFGGKWKAISREYIDELVDFTYHGWWVFDLYDRGNLYYFRKRLANKFLHMTVWRNQPERGLNQMKRELTYCSAPNEEEFIDATKRYIERLFTAENSNQGTMMVDQLVPPSNVWRYTRYFDDIKVVVVDRDPRDVYALEVKRWRDGVIPYENVQDFISWFKYTRAHRLTEEYDENTVLLIRFEDLIYDYEASVAKIEEFLDLEPAMHKSKGSKFDPRKSIKNTRVWVEYDDLAADVEYIEAELETYLYPFPVDRAVRA